VRIRSAAEAPTQSTGTGKALRRVPPTGSPDSSTSRPSLAIMVSCCPHLDHAGLVCDAVGVPHVVVVAEHHEISITAGADALHEVLRDARGDVRGGGRRREDRRARGAQQVEGAVRRTVIDDDQSIGLTGLRRDTLQQGRQPPLCIAGDEDRGDGRHRRREAASFLTRASYWSVTVSHW